MKVTDALLLADELRRQAQALTDRAGTLTADLDCAAHAYAEHLERGGARNVRCCSAVNFEYRGPTPNLHDPTVKVHFQGWCSYDTYAPDIEVPMTFLLQHQHQRQIEAAEKARKAG